MRFHEHVYQKDQNSLYFDSTRASRSDSMLRFKGEFIYIYHTCSRKVCFLKISAEKTKNLLKYRFLPGRVNKSSRTKLFFVNVFPYNSCHFVKAKSAKFTKQKKPHNYCRFQSISILGKTFKRGRPDMQNSNIPLDVCKKQQKYGSTKYCDFIFKPATFCFLFCELPANTCIKKRENRSILIAPERP